MKDCWGRTTPTIAKELKLHLLAFNANGRDRPQGAYFLHQGSPGGSGWVILPVLYIILASSSLLRGFDVWYFFNRIQIQIHSESR